MAEVKAKRLLIGGHITLTLESSGSVKLVEGVSDETVFQCFLHNRQAHYTEARLNTWKSHLPLLGSSSGPLFKSGTPRIVHASYVTVPWSKKEGTSEKSILDIRYASRAATLVGIQYLNVHLSKEMFLMDGFVQLISAMFAELDAECTLLFELSGNLPSTAKRLEFEKMGLKTPMQRLRRTGEVIGKLAGDKKWGLCLDTAHAFVTGQKLSSTENVKALIADASDVKAIHLNGSLSKYNSGRDLHAPTRSEKDMIWGVESSGLKELLLWAREKQIPIILERGSEEGLLTVKQYEKEIASLRKLIGEGEEK